MPLTRGRSLKSSSLRQQQNGENKQLASSDLLPVISASPRNEHHRLHGTATPTGNTSWSPKASGEMKFNPRPRSPTPTPVSKWQTNQASSIHPRACGYSPETFKERQDDRSNHGHPLPLPPSPPSSPPVHLLRNNSTKESVQSLHSRWKKGKLLGRGTFGHVYVGFNRYLSSSLFELIHGYSFFSHLLGVIWKNYLLLNPENMASILRLEYVHEAKFW